VDLAVGVLDGRLCGRIALVQQIDEAEALARERRRDGVVHLPGLVGVDGRREPPQLFSLPDVDDHVRDVRPIGDVRHPRPVLVVLHVDALELHHERVVHCLSLGSRCRRTATGVRPA
jgi:hypothetical protein